MTNEEAIKYLKQLSPNGGHCWLDEQRIEAIGVAIDALETYEKDKTQFARLMSFHEETRIFPAEQVYTIFHGKPTDPDILTVVLKDGARHYCDEVQITD